MCPTWPSKVVQINWQFMAILLIGTVGTIIHPLMWQRGANYRLKNNYVLLREQASRLPRAVMCGQLLASSDPSAPKLSLLASLRVLLPLSGAISQPPMPIVGPDLSIFGSQMSFAHHVLPKIWPPLGCKRFFCTKLSIRTIAKWLFYVMGGGWELSNTKSYVTASAITAPAVARL